MRRYDACRIASVQTELLQLASRYTAQCIHCARVVFRGARRLGDVQVHMIENHVLLCRPLVAVEQMEDLLGHFRITESAT